MADEPDASRSYGMGPSANLDIKTEAAQASVNAMTQALKGLQDALSSFGNAAYSHSEKINRHLKSIGDNAAKVTSQLNSLNGALGLAGGGGGGRAGGGGGGGGGGGIYGSGGGGGNESDTWVSSATSAIARVAGKEMSPGFSLGGILGASTDETSFTKDLMMAPLRYLRTRINTNRDVATAASGGLNMVANQQNTTTGNIMSQLARFPGSIYGTPQDLMGLFGAAPSLGASFAFGAAGGRGGGAGQGVRAGGFFQGVREMQMLNPMASVGELAGSLGGYAANTGAQQKSMMLTGGAMGIIGAGGRQKSLSEWAESILRWFEGLRPGADRGKGFDYGQLMAQYFPGSNIDAWFSANGVPSNMRDYWWSYALGKASQHPDTSAKFVSPVKPPEENNVAWQRLRSSSELTRTEFSLAGQMAPQYARRESANRWFNSLMGQMQEDLIPGIGKGRFSFMQYLPDALEDLLMTTVERGATGIFGGGDVGDIGDSYGEMGGTGLSGLHPDMKSKVGAMMQANPRLRMNSGLRDTGLQRKLKAKGHSRVSGKPSAHTRGMAADLGPASEYGWIMKNAKRFGLASGRGHGEPWHVGMQGTVPGVGDLDDTILGANDMFDDFFSMFGGGKNGVEGMAGLVTQIMRLLSSGFGKLTGGSDNSFNMSPDALFDTLVGASRESNRSGIGGGFSGGSGGGSSGGGGGGGFGARGGGAGTPASIAAATALFNAGFRSRKELETVTAIAYRESGWNPLAKNPNTSDRGLMQINMTGNKATMQEMGYNEADLMDIQKNANIAHRVYEKAGNQFWPWAISPIPGVGWDRNGDPLAFTQGSNAAQVVRDANLPGLIGDAETMMNYPAQRSGGNVVFQNQFNITNGGGSGSSNGGMDVRRTVVLIADHLEDEMKRRLARTA